MKRNPFSLAVFLTLTASLALSSESVRFTTTVPAPYGFYNQLITRDNAILARDGGNVGIGTSNPTAKLHVEGAIRVKRAAFHEFVSGGAGSCVYAGIVGPCLGEGESVPKPGQVFYNRDLDRFYYTSGLATALDQGGWFKPMSGFDGRVVVNGNNGSLATIDGYWRWLRAWTADPGTVVGYPTLRALRYAASRNTSNGLYSITAEGRFCVTLPPASGNLPINYSLYHGIWGVGWTMVATGGPEPIDTTGPGPYCANVSIQSMVMMNRGRHYDFIVNVRRTSTSGLPPGSVISADGFRIIVQRIINL